MRQQNVPINPFDDDRFYVFGYGEGGMMAHRLIRVYPGKYAAGWVLSGSHGGRAHAGITNLPLVTNGPLPNAPPTSMYIHYGELDDFVKPAPINGPGAPVMSMADYHRQFDESTNDLLSAKWARADLTPPDAADAYLASIGGSWGPAAPGNDLLGGTASVVTASGGAVGDVSPQGVTHHDPAMDHINLVCNNIGGAYANLEDIPPPSPARV